MAGPGAAGQNVGMDSAPSLRFADTAPTEVEVRSASVLDPWRAAAVRDLTGSAAEHTIHAYFNTCPESPDGSRVLFYASSSEDGDGGELRVLERATGGIRTIARIARVEDAHRVACQQWADHGRSVVFHDCREGRWMVVAVDQATGVERVLAVDRQIGFGTPSSPWVPLYGCHWNPRGHRDLELADVRDGRIVTAVTMEAVVAAHRPWLEATFGGVTGLSIFFPVLSPDGTKVFFKVAKGRGGDDVRGMDASHRDGKFVWDLVEGVSIRRFDSWGHPSWAPGSDGIVEKGNVLVSLVDGSEHHLGAGAPSNHPSLSVDGRLFVTDADHSRSSGVPGEWGITVGGTAGEGHLLLHRFSNAGGARSWRHPHPHPVFSADGRRIYFNVSAGRWTRLHVAEIAP